MGQHTILTGAVTDGTRWNKAGEQDAVNFTLVTSVSRKNKETGEYENFPTFHKCVRFTTSGAGEKLANHLSKGRTVEIQGEVRTNKDKPGQNRAGEAKIFRNKVINVDELNITNKAKEPAAA